MRASFIQNILINGAVSANGVSGIYNLSYADQLILYVNARTRNGSSVLTFNVESSPDQVSWSTIGTALTVNAVNRFNKAETNFGKYVRITWTLAGGTGFSGIDIYIQAKG
jgi:hypothetical protein